MNDSSRIHRPGMRLKSAAGKLLRLLGDINYPKDELIVVNYHGTPQKFLAAFEKQIVILRSRFNILSPGQLNKYFSGNLLADKCSLLLTFDDGLRNNLGAVKVLDKYNLKAYFFIVPGFVDTPVPEQKAFYLRHIRPLINPKIDSEPEDFEAMNWSELKQLIRSGHAIGSHTYTHSLVSSLADETKTFHEIAESKNRLQSELGIPVDAFCSINNTLESVGPEGKQLIKAHYRYHFTTLPGLNRDNKNPLFVKRRNIECYWPLGAVYYALGKTDLIRWRSRVRFFDALPA